MLLYESLCTDSTACYSILKPIFKNIIINFTEPKFIVFSYVVGLMLYEFGRACFKSLELLKTILMEMVLILLKNKLMVLIQITISLIQDKITNRDNKTDKEPNDIEIYNYLDEHNLAKDVYVMQLFYSSIARMLLGLIILSIFFYTPFSRESILLILNLIFIFIVIILIWINHSADAEVHNLGNQIKKVIKDSDPKYKKIGNEN